MTSQATNDLSQSVQAFRAELLRRERDAASQMLLQYARAWRVIHAELDALLGRMEAAILAGEKIRPGWLYQQGRLGALLHQVERQIVSFAGVADRSITAAQRDVAQLAQISVKALVDQQLGPGISVRWARLPADALESVVGTLSDGSPLASLLGQLGPDAVAGVRDALFNGIALGLHSSRIAEQVQLALGGNLVRALSISRTETLRSYREVSQASFRANDRVVAKWRWEAGHSNNTCFPAGVVVSGPVAQVGTSRHYTGELVTIRTASGEYLSMTPNHPILTPHGWVAGGLLMEGSYVIRCTDGQRAVAAVHVDDYQMPTRIEQAVESLNMVAAEVPTAAPDFHGDGVGSDVHVVRSNGLLWDGGQVAFLKPGVQHRLSGRDVGFLPYGSECLPFLSHADPILDGGDALSEAVAEHDLARPKGGISAADRHDLLQPTTLNAVYSKAGGDGRSGDAVRTRERECSLASEVTLGNIRIGEPECVMLLQPMQSGTGATGFFGSTQEPTASQLSQEAFVVDAADASGMLGALAGQVSADRIIEVSRRTFSGQVYNLQTAAHWYIANNIIAKNCAVCWSMDGTLHDLDEPLDDHVRGACVPVPITFSYAELGFPDVEENRPDYTPGVERFRELSEPDQLTILGPAKFAAYHDGRIELGDLVRRTESQRWGTMRSEDSLKNALVKAARRKYG